ncbi:PQQ-dependent sugar dehydrogenase [Leisingera aquaemixtae]|uniref:PQQ-dependent sugar dehydrogenase n=1 Tax=Leisingera aquaemixtae TaxID=1396826 RepID=A0ABY5WNW0_9RHOB|nr:PQQ-dependent sugar dehydrogenase [Leisingera aquaemixtae]UWQ43153.1 PQQ-dependent sugar dehydrogenase [Leisingera aquaemixtae]
MLQLLRLVTLALALLTVSTAARAETLSSSQGTLRVTRMAAGFDVPWAFAFLPDGGLLVTERDGQLFHVQGGQKQRVSGTPAVAAEGQGGLLDVMVPRDFASSREVFLTYAKRQGRGAGTALAVGKLSRDNAQLTGVRLLFEAAPGSRGGRHFGARVVEARDGTLFLSLGERGDRPSAQNLRLHQGSVVRINRDGTVPASNPFTGRQDAQPEIWSYGHRNPQGMALDLQGNLWVAEHGAKGGDEVNRVRKGANYGWPVISYGRHYSGARIGDGTAKPGMEQPQWYWDPSIAPSGMMIYSGRMWPKWRGDIFVGSLKFDYISRLSGAPLKEVEQLQSSETGRIRDVQEAPDGSIWFASETEGAVFRLSR